MSKYPLTIGMATYDDYDGVYFTLQALRTYHDVSNIEIIVVDNHPESIFGQQIKGIIENWMTNKPRGSVRYIPFPEPLGTSQSRNEVFKQANGNVVLCIDCHVLIVPGAIDKLLQYYTYNPDSQDLISGPLLDDSLVGCITHFKPEWRAEMYGIWDIDERGLNPNNPPFEIPGNGLGLFACKKDAWLGFNPHFRGFGGEELYIHEKYRQAGRKNLCLPFLRWIHRFGRPPYIQYPLTRWHKARNYVLGHLELGLDIQPIYDHFVSEGKLSQYMWDYLVEDPITHQEEPVAHGPGTELKKLISQLGIDPHKGCGCNQKINQMDAWGVKGCRKRIDQIVQWMRDGQDKWKWTEKFNAAKNAALTGIAFQINWLDPFPGLINLAIDNAEHIETLRNK